MRIAFVSYEFPPDTAHGGIATYVRDAVTMLAGDGHDVEVFCGGDAEATFRDPSGATVHRFPGERLAFPTRIVASFCERHRLRPFEVLEGPDYLAEAGPVHQAFPALPYVVKLHTPLFLIQGILDRLTPWPERLRRLRTTFFQLRTGRRPLRPWRHDALMRAERINARSATLVASPSLSICKHLGRAWSLDENRIVHFPCPFIPDPRFLALAPAPASKVVGYIGRLEPRKGVHVLARAMREVWEKIPDARLRLIGRDMPSHRGDVPMSTLVSKIAGAHASKIDFVGPVPRDRLPELLADVGVCVFPSIWESFGLVVLEAIAAGRPVICSSGSGMAENIGEGTFGRLARPGDARSLAAAILRHFEHQGHGGPPDAETCRRQMLPRYLPARVLSEQVACYHRAISLAGPLAPLPCR